MKSFDWIVVGGGISGISIAEILSREGHSVALIEKNKKLASVATREFHEWVHTGSLYTLVKDQMKTLKYILGSLDDLLEFYSSFKNMNVTPTESGLKINQDFNGWFNKNFIDFKYRLKNRKIFLNWMFSIARSIALIEGIKKHDWLRRRAGIIESIKSEYYLPIIKNLFKIFFTNKKFYKIQSTDFTTNSRLLLKDLLSTAVNNGVEIFTDNELLKIEDSNGEKIAHCSKEKFKGSKIVVCVGGGTEKFTELKIKKSLAPIAIVKNVPKNTNSFVELDYFKKKCINIITKNSSYGMIGGISLSDKKEVDKYFDYMIEEHKKTNPQLEVLEKYVGVKNEIISKGQSRNYIFHINQDKKSKNTWSVIPGKFTLAFSIAPEFYRLVYKKNPKKFHKTVTSEVNMNNLIDETVWGEVQNKSK
tara:strand:- start:1495 stop:2748 length:1254 start_codon:yes stop_codon:yes gene_type:complete